MANSYIKIFALALLCFILGSTIALAQQNEFEQGNRFYKDKDYSSAIRLYQSALGTGLESASLYFNLGNAYFKNGDLGHAVLYYMKAKRLDPSDADITSNLEFARRFSSVQMEGVRLNPIGAFFEKIVNPYRLNSLAWFSSALFILLMLILAFKFLFNPTTPVFRVMIITLVLFTIASAGLTTYKYRVDYLDQKAVIIADDARVLSGPTDQSELELEGAPGLIVSIIDESAGYYNVLFENKRIGWIRKDLVALI